MASAGFWDRITSSFPRAAGSGPSDEGEVLAKLRFLCDFQRARPDLRGSLPLVFLLAGPVQAAKAAPPRVPIVFCQLPAGGEAEPRRGLLPSDYGDGGRLAVLRPDGQVTVLTKGFAAACDPDVSVDGRRILFAGKRQADSPWNIWEIHPDGTGARQITTESRDCRSPIYLSTLYTITSTKPWYTLLFVGADLSEGGRTLNEQGSSVSTSLYTVRLDGSELRRITFGLNNTFDPYQMSDGRVLFSSWQYEHGSPGRVALFDVNSDGTDYALFGATQGRKLQLMPCVTAHGLATFVEADRVEWDGAGQLACVRTQRPHHSHRRLTDDSKNLYHSPSPLDDGTLLVSRRPADGRGTHAIYSFDPATGELERIFDGPDTHDIQAKAMRARAEPDGRSSVVNPERSTGKLYCLNVYDSTLRTYLAEGNVRRLRVLEGVAPLEGVPPEANSPAPLVARRFLGVVPVERDGSFHLEIPADLPVELQTVDADGMALATCRWIWVKPGERRGCIGCHEDPELTPENLFVEAAARPGNRLTLAPQQRRAVVFREHVLPIVQNKCALASCHASDRTPLRLTAEPQGVGPDDGTRAYTALTARAGAVAENRGGVRHHGEYVDPGRARTSYLVWRLLGRDTSRPWDRPERTRGTETFKPMPPPGKSVPLTEDEKRAFVEWIDLGAREGP